jgi:uncharacterized protein YjbI with pentapeptide repeats
MKKLLILLLLSLGFLGTTSAGEVETNILKLKSLNACKGCSFIGIDFGGADFWGADLSGADLKNANISGVTLCNTETPWGVDDSGC